MKIGIIIETKEPEKSWNAMRFANTAMQMGNEVRVFLMGEAVEIENQVDEKYNVAAEIRKFFSGGGSILACGTCLISRKMEGTEACPMSNMMDCVNLVLWADKTVTF